MSALWSLACLAALLVLFAAALRIRVYGAGWRRWALRLGVIRRRAGGDARGQRRRVPPRRASRLHPGGGVHPVARGERHRARPHRAGAGRLLLPEGERGRPRRRDHAGPAGPAQSTAGGRDGRHRPQSRARLLVRRAALQHRGDRHVEPSPAGPDDRRPRDRARHPARAAPAAAGGVLRHRPRRVRHRQFRVPHPLRGQPQP